MGDWESLRQGYYLGSARHLEASAHARAAEHEAALAEGLAGEEADTDDEWCRSWYGGRLRRDVWACPRNLAGFAPAFLA